MDGEWHRPGRPGCADGVGPDPSPSPLVTQLDPARRPDRPPRRHGPRRSRPPASLRAIGPRASVHLATEATRDPVPAPGDPSHALGPRASVQLAPEATPRRRVGVRSPPVQVDLARRSNWPPRRHRPPEDGSHPTPGRYGRPRAGHADIRAPPAARRPRPHAGEGSPPNRRPRVRRGHPSGERSSAGCATRTGASISRSPAAIWIAQPGFATATTGAPVAAIASAFWRRSCADISGWSTL